jgi:hypothetical protein
MRIPILPFNFDRWRKFMKKWFFATLVLVIALAAGSLAGFYSPATASETVILEFDDMVGLTSAYVGGANLIRDVPGAGVPWAIGPTHGELKANGKLEIDVQGLVFAAGLNTGSNTVANFRAKVSCLTSSGAIETKTTDLFPATQGPATSGGGNAKIEAMLALPEPCLAPIVFVTSPGGAWFAVNGD